MAVGVLMVCMGVIEFGFVLSRAGLLSDVVFVYFAGVPSVLLAVAGAFVLSAWFRGLRLRGSGARRLSRGARVGASDQGTRDGDPPSRGGAVPEPRR